MTSNDAVSIYEVSLRDGLQNESAFVPTADKLRLLGMLTAAGLRRVEITSFVNPKWIPALADADEMSGSARAPEGVMYSALIPNARGFERARGSKLGELAVVVSISETHNKKNINRTVADTLAEYAELVPAMIQAGFRVRGYLSTVWGCPYEGVTNTESAVKVGKALLEMGCYQLSLGDTIGVATPAQSRNVLRLFRDHVGLERVAMHMHDTRGTALANVLVGLEEGVRDIDSSLGGLGGCPYAPGAAGNLCTEDLAYMLEGMGMKTGLDVPALVLAAREAEALVGRKLPGKVHQAGPWSF